LDKINKRMIIKKKNIIMYRLELTPNSNELIVTNQLIIHPQPKLIGTEDKNEDKFEF
jgi:hypothetical protein